MREQQKYAKKVSMCKCCFPYFTNTSFKNSPLAG